VDGELTALDELVANLRRVDAVGVAIAEEALPEVLEEARRTAAAGTSPDGEPWAPKNDGGRALPNAAAAIVGRVSGVTKAVIVLTLGRPYVYHHGSKAKDKRRPILFTPANGVPQRMQDAIRRAAVRVVGRVLGGGR
jgi:hypothetical protein